MATSSDLLSKIGDELNARLRELRPLVAEYERLLLAASALNVSEQKPPRPRRRAVREAPVPAPASPTSRRRRGAPKRAQRGAAAGAIVAALEHGSHTVSELAVVTAMRAPIVNSNLRRLQQAGTITRTKREGDGKAAYALASAST
jgi:predicted Rossmann fold nucleotide-binding protein DprA/Smf involved in DNA uptake